MSRYDIERYLAVQSARQGDISVNGRLVFLLDTTGTAQVWSVTEPQGWPEQHTVFDERVTFVDASPTRAEAVFGMDEGGNERTQLFSLALDSNVITPLTDRPDAKHRWGGWSSDGDRFAFASNRRDPAVFDVYVGRRDEADETATRVHEGDGWLSVPGWAPDDGRLLIHEAHASFDHDLYTLALETGEVTHQTPHEGAVRYSSPTWGPDSESVYLVTDRDSDTLRLERLELATGTFSVVEDGGEWNIEGVAVEETSRRVAYTRNVDGYSTVSVGEFASADRIEPLPEPSLSLPEGVTGGVSFGPDGDRVAVTVTGRGVNANVYVIEAQTGETTRWTAASTAGIPTETFIEPALVHYPTFDERAIPAFVSLPERDPPEGGYPVVVDIHGGPESQRRPSFAAVTQYLLQCGYAVFEPNVRGSAGYGSAYAALDDVEKRMDAVRDLRAGVEWLHDHPEVDPDRIAAMGGSYGGFMVLAALCEFPDLWAAGVDIVGIANFVTFLSNTGDWRRELREAEYGSLESDRAFLESISPLNTVSAIDAPLFVLHGENDPRVPVSEAEAIVEAAREQDVPVRSLIFEDEGHGFAKRDNQIEAYRAVTAFLDEHV